MLKRKQLLDASKCRRMKCEECSMSLLCSDAERFETEQSAQTALTFLDMLKEVKGLIKEDDSGLLYIAENPQPTLEKLGNLLKEVEG